MAQAFERVVAEAKADGGAAARAAPRTTPVSRVDEALAAKKLRLRWTPDE
jgi:hypothetical protein